MGEKVSTEFMHLQVRHFVIFSGLSWGLFLLFLSFSQSNQHLCQHKLKLENAVVIKISTYVCRLDPQSFKKDPLYTVHTNFSCYMDDFLLDYLIKSEN